MCCSGINHDKEKSPTEKGLMTAGSACARMDVLIFCVLSAVAAPPQMPSIQDKHYRRHWTEACLVCWLIYAATMPQCPAQGPADGDGSGGSAAGGAAAGLVLWEEEEGVALWQRNNESPTTPTPRHGCLCTMYQNATCRIPICSSFPHWLPPEQ